MKEESKLILRFLAYVRLFFFFFLRLGRLKDERSVLAWSSSRCLIDSQEEL